MGDTRHGVKDTFYDNLGEGWRMECFCGFTTSPDDKLTFTASEMDDHFEDIRDAAPPVTQ